MALDRLTRTERTNGRRRRSTHTSIPLLIALFALVRLASTQAPPAPLNVVIILADDLGWIDLSCQGSSFYDTPHIDRLAREGIRFTDAYAAAAVCSPTRAALLTGRAPARTGVTDWIRSRFQRPGHATPEHNPTAYEGGPRRKLLCPPNPFWLASDEVTLAELLAARGYATCHVGKWHLGDDAWYPEHQGFDENHGGCDFGQPPSYFDPYTNAQLPDGIPGLPPRRAGEYLSDREADEAAAFIRRQGQRPFFLYLAHYAVHTPIQAKAEVAARYARKAQEDQPKGLKRNAQYAAMVESVDDSVGKVLATLDEQGIADRTLVVFTSDNGGLLGPTDNSPLRSGKGYPYEGGIRVPLIVRWPGVIAPGRTSSLPATSVDWLPTVADATSTPRPERELDGMSLLPHLRAADAAMPQRRLFWFFPHYRGDETPYGIVRDGAWKLIVRYEGPTHELYDLSADPSEAHDLASAEPARVRELAAALADHLTATGAHLPRPNPAYRALPRVLLLGDSISMAYTPHVRALLRGTAEVFRPMRSATAAENCEGTDRGLARLEAWLAADGGEWDVIHFNFGLHDLKHVQPETGANSDDPTHPSQTPLDEYEAQLGRIVDRLRATGAELVFATTTPVPAGRLRPFRRQEDVVRYNEVATALMRAQDVAIDDLYAFVLPRQDQLQQANNVHFTDAGSRALAAEVAARVREAVQRAAQKRTTPQGRK